MELNQIETNSQRKSIEKTLPVAESNSIKSGETKSRQSGGGAAQSTGNDQDKMSYEETSEIVESLEGYMNALQTNISFSVDSKSEQVIVTIKNRETGETIRQIPPEALVELQEKMKELTGMIFSEKV